MLGPLILTASRSGELRQMRRDEIDVADAVWIVPASHMKARVVHRAPLTPRAIEDRGNAVGRIRQWRGVGLRFPV